MGAGEATAVWRPTPACDGFVPCALAMPARVATSAATSAQGVSANGEGDARARVGVGRAGSRPARLMAMVIGCRWFEGGTIATPAHRTGIESMRRAANACGLRHASVGDRTGLAVAPLGYVWRKVATYVIAMSQRRIGALELARVGALQLPALELRD